MFNPCRDYCYIRHGKQYTKDCDDKCDYAKAIKEIKDIQENRKQSLAEIKELLLNALKDTFSKKGKVIILSMAELNKLIELIRKI